MKESYWGYWLILLGIFIIVVMMLVQSASTTNTQDYYQLKEVANSALIDSVDSSYYQETGDIRIKKELFVANFLKRFAQTVSLTDTYQIDFYDLYEAPPKVSVKITTDTGNFMVADEATSLDVVNSIDLIAELNYDPSYITTENKVPGDPGESCSGASDCAEKIVGSKCWYYS